MPKKKRKSASKRKRKSRSSRKSGGSSPRKGRTKQGIMAKKRRTRVRYSKPSRRSSRRSGNSFTKEAMSIAIATIAEPTIDSVISQFAGSINIGIGGVETDDLIKVGIGYFLGKKGGMLGNTAKYVGLFGLRNIVKQVVSGGLLGATAAPATGQNNFVG